MWSSARASIVVALVEARERRRSLRALLAGPAADDPVFALERDRPLARSGHAGEEAVGERQRLGVQLGRERSLGAHVASSYSGPDQSSSSSGPQPAKRLPSRTATGSIRPIRSARRSASSSARATARSSANASAI